MRDMEESFTYKLQLIYASSFICSFCKVKKKCFLIIWLFISNILPSIESKSNLWTNHWNLKFPCYKKPTIFYPQISKNSIFRHFWFWNNDIRQWCTSISQSIRFDQFIYVYRIGLLIHHNDNVDLNLKRKIISERQITDLIDIDKRFIEQQNPFQFIQLNKFYFDWKWKMAKWVGKIDDFIFTV